MKPELKAALLALTKLIQDEYPNLKYWSANLHAGGAQQVSLAVTVRGDNGDDEMINGTISARQ